MFKCQVQRDFLKGIPKEILCAGEISSLLVKDTKEIQTNPAREARRGKFGSLLSKILKKYKQNSKFYEMLEKLSIFI